MLEYIFGQNYTTEIVIMLIISLVIGFIIDLKIDKRFNVLVWIACSACVMFVMIFMHVFGSVED